jgi:PD-(D/E)XK nuclease superfamily protein
VSTAGLTHLPVSGTLRSPTIDFSSLNTLTSCPKRWHYRYVQGLPEDASAALTFGSLMHELWGEFWRGSLWQATLKAEVQAWQDANPEAEFVPEYFDKAFWLMSRYETVYGPERRDIKVIGVEVPFRVRLPGRYGWLVGRIDGLFEIDHRLWVAEFKTMADWTKLDTYTWDPQVSLYYWAAQQMGYEPFGILVDAARTYRWKGERPAEESFDRRWVDRNPEHLVAAIEEAKTGLTMAKLFIAGTVKPYRNVTRDCAWCPYRNPCVAELCFDDLVIPNEFEFDG